MNTTTAQFTTKVQEYIASLVDNNNECAEDIVDFIDHYGEELFLSSYELYRERGEQMGYDVVDALMEEYPTLLEKCNETYRGNYASVEDFAKKYSLNTYGDIPDCVVVNWHKTWHENLVWEFTNCEHFGREYIFERM